MPATGPIEVLLLAAGRSQRMRGIDKLLLPVDGEPMLRRSARRWLDAGHAVFVMTAPGNDAALMAIADLPVTVIVNPRAMEGQHTSIAAGLAALPLSARAVAIALADQPLLTVADCADLVAKFDDVGGDRIVIPRHGGQRGNPVLLPGAIARALRDDPQLGPPRRFIDAHPELVVWCDADHPRYTSDIDTPEDAARLLAGRTAS